MCKCMHRQYLTCFPMQSDLVNKFKLCEVQQDCTDYVNSMLHYYMYVYLVVHWCVCIGGRLCVVSIRMMS